MKHLSISASVTLSKKQTSIFYMLGNYMRIFQKTLLKNRIESIFRGQDCGALHYITACNTEISHHVRSQGLLLHG